MLPENGEELQDKVVKPHSFEKVSQDKLESHYIEDNCCGKPEKRVGGIRASY